MEEVFLETSARKVGDTLRIDALEVMDPEEEAVPWVKDWVKAI
jgi:hypothetical protein